MIDDILDFSKIEAGRMDVDVVDFDLSRVVHEVLAASAGAAQTKRLELACLIHHDVPRALRGDPGRLRQVLTNLVGNAVKFTDEGEVVLRVTLESSPEDSALVRFEVSDTGIGVDEALASRLFQSFVQADGSATRRHGGTGLGLAISKRLVTLMGGEIGLARRSGRGSTFHFTVPFGRQPSAAPTPAARPPSLAGRRVLVVDDNATNRRILREQLGHWGMRVAVADGGAKALALLRQAAASGATFDLAILDMRMPGMDGLALARAIKDLRTPGDLKLVLLTSFGQRGHGAEASRIGISAYLTKPVDEADLYDSLVEVLASDGSQPKRRLVTRHSLREARPPIAAHVLVAEDNEVNQKVAVRILERLGYKVDVADDGNEALEACERTRYDVVLMDVQMPGLDGFEVDAAHPCPRAGRPAHADRRHDGERDEGRSGALPRGRHGRLRGQAGDARGARHGAAALGERRAARGLGGSAGRRRGCGGAPRRGDRRHADVAGRRRLADRRAGQHLPEPRPRPARLDP